MSKDRAKNAFDTMASRKANCAQSTFTAFSDEMGMSKKLALSVSQGFGGGMGHSGSVCGAVTGAYMALGLASPASEETPRQNIEKTYALMDEFNKQFKARHGSLNCTELTGYDLGKQEEMVKARDAGVFIKKCPVFVRDAVEIVESLLKLP
jgi:C_GCAxxG_C_C family probable redox protein